MVLGKPDSYVQKKIILDRDLTAHTKMNSAWITDLNVRPEAIQFLGENPDGKLLDTDLGDDFLNLTTKAKATKAKINEWGHIELNSFCRAKGTINREKAAYEWGKHSRIMYLIRG